MKYISVFIFCLFLLTGCFTIKPTAPDTNPVISNDQQITRLTNERVEDVDGETYIIVTFPKNSIEHRGFMDEETGEYVVIGILPKK